MKKDYKKLIYENEQTKKNEKIKQKQQMKKDQK